MGHKAKLKTPLSSRFVGRKKEMTAIKEHLTESIEGSGRLVLIVGETGIGKSRLFDELGDYAKTKGVLYLKGRCLYQENAEPYLPFIEAFSDYISHDNESEDPNDKSVIKGLSNEQFSLGILPLDENSENPFSKKPSLNIQQERDRLFEALYKIVIDISEKSPLLLVIDDIQWADDSSLKLLHYLARNIRNTNVLMCAAYSPGDLEKNGARVHPLSETLRRMRIEDLFYQIRLDRFDKKSTSLIIESLVGRKKLPNEFTKILYDESEGNPFFVEEVLKSLINEGLIDVDSYTWDGKIDTSQIMIPGTIKDVIARRIDRLDDKTRTILGYASIIGNRFSFELLFRMSNEKEETVIDAIDAAISANIIHEDSNSEEEQYKFDHALIRDVIYNSMTRSRRRVMHKRIGQIIEELYSDRISDRVYNLAHHFNEGKDPKKALSYAVRAGQMAVEAYAPEDAIRYFIMALRTLEDMEITLENMTNKLAVVSKLGDIHNLIGEWDTSMQYHEDALKLSGRLNNDLEKARAFRSYGHIKQHKGEYDDALEYFKKGLEISEALTDIHGLADTYRGLGRVFWRKGEFEKAIDYYEWSLGLTEKIQDEQVMAATCIELGNVYSEMGDWEKALEYQENSMRLLEKVKNFYDIGRSYNNMGVTYARKGDMDKAVLQYEKSIEISDKTGNIRMSGWALFNAGEAYARLGQFDKAIECVNRSLLIFERLGEKLGTSGSFLSYGVIYKLKKEWDLAINYFEESMRIRNELAMPYRLADGYYEFGLLYKEKGDLNKASVYFKKADEIFENLGAKELLKKVKSELKSING